MDKNLINIKELTKTYSSGSTQITAVDSVNLTIEAGSIVSITGPSGSGKSTLLTMLGGITKPTSGSIEVDMLNVYALDENQRAAFRREYIGFVFQAFQLIPFLTVLENVMLPAIVKNQQDKIQRELANNLLSEVGLFDKGNRLAHELSGGEQQRVAIARALINDPAIVLADEPTGNLDSQTGYEIIKLFEQLNKNGKTIIIVTHDKEIAEMTDTTFSFKDGKLSDVIERNDCADVISAELEMAG